MICSRPVDGCTECGDTLIHQSNRGPHESSSAFGQYVHDRIGLEMFWLDIDGASYKLKTKVLRIIEHKPQGSVLSKGQKEVLPLLAKSIQLLASTGLVHEQSGVFVVRSDHPHDSGVVEQIEGWKSRAIWPTQDMDGQLWKDFLRGEVIDFNPGRAA